MTDTRSYDSLDALYANITNLSRQFEVIDVRENASIAYSGFQDPKTGEFDKRERKDVPKTIVLHDMGKGYLQDRYTKNKFHI